MSWFSRLAAFAFIGFVMSADSQEDAGQLQEKFDRIQQEHQDQLRRSRLIGSGNDLAIEMPNGELSYFRDMAGCGPPVSRGGTIQIDCTILDGPVYYFDESTREFIEVCSFWFPDPRRCPPKQWPIEVADCDGAIPPGISGTWRFHATPTFRGFRPSDGGWTMTITEASILFDFYGFSQVERSYSVTHSDDLRYEVELQDESSETRVLRIEPGPCGFFVESDAECDEFCRNLAEELGTPTDEELREVVTRSLGEKLDVTQLEWVLSHLPNEAERRQRDPQPLFPERAYFLKVTGD